MTGERPELESRWLEAITAIEMVAVDPLGLGGALVRCWPGLVRDRVVEGLREALPGSAPLLKVPVHVTEDRLLGGLSIAHTLRTGKLVVERGVLLAADGGMVQVPMSERLDALVAAQLCAVLDRHQVVLERDGLAQTLPCRIGVLALDEGLDDEKTPAPLAERLALHLDLSQLSPRLLPASRPRAEQVERARLLLPEVTVPEALVEALCEVALELGVSSLRASVQAVIAARVHAALAARTVATDADAAAAARLVLGPRATRLPSPDADQAPAPAPEDSPTEAPPSPPEPSNDSAGESALEPPPEPDLSEILLAAAEASLPAELLELASGGRAPRVGPRSSGRAGAARASTRGGRPAGARAGVPQPGERLNLVETLRAAAPWQRLRKASTSGAASVRRVEVRRDDLRVSRFVQKTESSVIFCVDASGSSALQRLAEAKGAVEQVLADCYVRRDHVALVAFRGTTARVLLSPTRSLARVRRCLADLAGGGGTPLAAGIDAGLTLALEARKRGRTPLLVMMTDARANVSRDGSHGRQADDDAMASARLVRAQQVKALFLDTSPRPRAKARALADEMGAAYVPLPRLDAKGISTRVQQLTR
jgi:magnesium chelatase subunit D